MAQPRGEYFCGPNKYGLYLYQRRVPLDLVDVLGRKVWHTTLGRNAAKAGARACALRDEHDALITHLRRPGGAEVKVTEEIERTWQPIREEALRREVQAVANAPDTFDWRHTPERVEALRKHPPETQRELLAVFIAAAFGTDIKVPMTKHMKNLLALASTVTPPEEPFARATFDAYASAAMKRLDELTRDADAPDRLSVLLTRRAKVEAIRESTLKGYRKSLALFTERFGDMRVGNVTAAILRQHRDMLVERGLQPTSVRTHFAPVGAILSFALNEGLRDDNPASGLTFPRDAKTVEDRKALPFTRDEARAILAEADMRWADNGRSRLSIERRRLYRHTVRALLHTGCRPHELWRLSPTDAGLHDRNGWEGRGLDIRDTKSGKRLIPCPDEAVPFADFVVSGGLNCLSESGDRAPTTVQIEERIKGFNEKQFGKLLVDLGIKRPRVSLMSTRPTFVVMVQKQADYKDELAENIIGHVGRAKMLRHYKSRAEMDEMLRAMNTVRY